MTVAEIHALFLQSSGVVIDTRKIEPNSFFVALKGERFDANAFAEEALRLGASYVLVDNPAYCVNEQTILVDDSLTALQELAQFHRKYLGLPIVALTGSNGKTTTKELIHSVLSQRYRCKATVGNLNNHIGVPLTLLSFDKSTEIGIVEMGANHQKEIEFLCQLTQPDFGYITNFGKAHLEGFGGVEGVIKGKSELYNYLSSHHKLAFVNSDDPIQVSKTKSFSPFTFTSTHVEADVQVSDIEAHPFVSLTFNSLRINSQLIGMYNAANIAAAIALGVYFKVNEVQIKTAIESYLPSNNRSQIITKGSIEIILDAYNANPSSMAVAISNFAQLERSPKLMILGDMFELGEESAKEHAALVDLVINSGVEQTYFVGAYFYAAQRISPGITFFPTYEDLELYCKAHPIHASVLLIKGSRGMALERLLDSI